MTELKKGSPSILNDLKQIEDSNKSDLARATELLMNDNFFRRKTRLNRRIISALTTLDAISQIWDIQFLKRWIPSYTQYLTSTDGKGRQEIVDITKYSIDRETQFREQMLNGMRR